MSKLRMLLLLSPVAITSLTACALVLGIEERELVQDTSVTCEHYCSVTMQNCTAAVAQYASIDSCLGTCNQLNLGRLGDQNVDTVGCRLRNADLAEQTGEKADYCVNAGPGGNGSCGSNCESYCKIMAGVCPEQFATEQECMTACATVPDHGNYNIGVPYEDSIQCRLYHLTSATVDTTHCPHAAGIIKCIPPPPDAGAD